MAVAKSGRFANRPYQGVPFSAWPIVRSRTAATFAIRPYRSLPFPGRPHARPVGQLPWALALLAALLVAAASAVAPAAAQAPVQVAIDAPGDGAQTAPELTVRGWAYAPGASGSAVSAVLVYLDGEGDDRGRLLGTATYGLPRPDVAAALGDPRLDAVGYELRLTLPPGEHRLAVYAQTGTAAGDAGWSAPAEVALTVTAPGAASSAARAPARGAPGTRAQVPGSVTSGTVCTSRAPNGTCLTYSGASGGIAMACSELNAEGECTAYVQSSSVSTACAQYGTGGQCLAASAGPAVNPPPGGVAQTTALCLEYNAAGQCNRYASSAAPEPTLSLTVQAMGAGTVLNWTALPAAATYDVLRCATPQLANCSAVSQSGATSYALPNRQNYWYAVRARAAGGQVIATSGLLGPL